MAFRPNKHFLQLLIMLFALSGCSLSGNRYSCPLEKGVRCLSTSEAYSQSHNGQVPKAVDGKQAANTVKTNHDTAKRNSSENEPYHVVKVRDFAKPLRTPSQVMRIWIAPWQDKQDDLSISGYLYTEIESRKWIYGLPNEGKEAFFTPLKKSPNNPSNKGK